jgi:hypothetical protein
VTRWLITEGMHWYQQGTGRFVPRWDKRLNCSSNSAREHWGSITTTCELFWHILPSATHYMHYY